MVPMPWPAGALMAVTSCASVGEAAAPQLGTDKVITDPCLDWSVPPRSCRDLGDRGSVDPGSAETLRDWSSPAPDQFPPMEQIAPEAP